jgi:DNA-binding HxlR family transcriptional regulator
MMLLEDVSMSLDDCVVIREVLSRVGDRWSVFVVCLLRDGSRRFSELRRANIGISQRMLTLTLRGLERDGLVIRTVSATAPRRVDYALSPLGRTLLTSVLDLAAWANTNRDEILSARVRFDSTERPRPKRSDVRELAPKHESSVAVAAFGEDAE